MNQGWSPNKLQKQKTIKIHFSVITVQSLGFKSFLYLHTFLLVNHSELTHWKWEVYMALDYVKNIVHFCQLLNP